MPGYLYVTLVLGILGTQPELLEDLLKRTHPDKYQNPLSTKSDFVFLW